MSSDLLARKCQREKQHRKSDQWKSHYVWHVTKQTMDTFGPDGCLIQYGDWVGVSGVVARRRVVWGRVAMVTSIAATAPAPTPSPPPGSLPSTYYCKVFRAIISHQRKNTLLSKKIFRSENKSHNCKTHKARRSRFVQCACANDAECSSRFV